MVSHTSEMRLGIDLTKVVSPAPDLQVLLFDEQTDTEVSIDLGFLREGSHEYSAPVNGDCLKACRLDGFTLYWTPASASSASAVVVPLRFTALEIEQATGSWEKVAAGFSAAGDWAGSSSAVVTRPTRAGLVTVFDVAASATAPELVRNDTPAMLPAVVTAGVISLSGNSSAPDQYPAFGIDGSSITVTSTIEANALPAIGNEGVLVDFSLVELLQTSTPLETTFEVWCHRPPPAAFLETLRGEGVRVVATHSSGTAEGLLNRSGPALAFELFVLAALGAALLSLGALVFAIASSSRKRAIEVAALAAVGVPREMLHRSLMAEYATIVTAGVALGLVAGLLTIRLALGSLPEFVPGRVGPVLSVWIPWPQVLVAAGLAFLLLLTGAAVATSLVMRRATPDCLRTSQ
jgi:hypothetical protein